MRRFSDKRKGLYILLTVAVIFLAYRMVRPMNIFIVEDKFALPIAETLPPVGLTSLHASECGECHVKIYEEWAASIHAKAWTDPYYQIDFIFDGSQQICHNCHTPLQNQQKEIVTGFRDSARFDPILKPNPDFDEELQGEGVTCAVCHLVDGVILGPYGDTKAPHPTRYSEEMVDGVGVCKKCHVVSGERWDTFYRVPPCGTVAEIREGGDDEIDCISCHMPGVVRPLVEGGFPRRVGRHLWRGGHHEESVRNALGVEVGISKEEGSGDEALLVTLTNVGAAHYLPTGTPDRHLTLEFKLKDGAGNVIKEKVHTLKRHVMWRPFILDLWDTRLPKGAGRKYDFPIKSGGEPLGAALEVTVRYHLLEEARRARIGYENEEPINYILRRYAVDLETSAITEIL